MKKEVIVLSTAICVIVFGSCRKSTEEEFVEANFEVAKKYIEYFQVISDDNSVDNVTITVNYDEKDRVSSISDGTSSEVHYYDGSNNLTSVSSDNETITMDEFYQSPYDAFEVGNVREYDDKLNPIEIQVFEDGYGSEILIVSVTYDPHPNPFFYTLKAAGILKVLDRVNLTFKEPEPSITKARLLIPYNNIRSITVKDLSGNRKYEARYESNYDQDFYPSGATVNVTTPTETSSFTLTYSYR